MEINDPAFYEQEKEYEEDDPDKLHDQMKENLP